MFLSPVMVRRAAYNHALGNALNATTGPTTGKPSFDLAQDDTSYTFSFDVPGIAKEQLTIGIEGNVVRLESVADAKRQYKAAYELPQDIDVAASEAKLENGVLTLKLAKLVPVNKVTQLPIH
ncbi:MAG: Hsp20/alpha crystallin family protein [Burkholderiaceae bacterium]|nr:Hsp20/alpha crystallin family protein [Burkholderiaceae bacterium]